MSNRGLLSSWIAKVVLLLVLFLFLIVVKIVINKNIDILREFIASPSIVPADLRGLEGRIAQERALKNNQPDKYAVLIRGSSEQRFVADVSIAYQVLLENGFKPENIYILANAKKRKEVFFHPIDDFATKNNLEALMNHLSNFIDQEDLLFIYLVDHGARLLLRNPDEPNRGIGFSVFKLKETILAGFELKLYLSEIHPKIGILLFNFCYSGGFADILGGGQYVAIADTVPDKEGESKSGDSFGGRFFEALSIRMGRRADANKDNRISLQEAFDYAKKHHFATRNKSQQPFIRSRIPLSEIFIDK